VIVGTSASLRIFGEARVGDEDLVRFGIDLTLGRIGHSELRVRDKATGQRYRVITRGSTEVSFIVGADFAYVEDSAFIPSNQFLSLNDTRTRVRVGIDWYSEEFSVFYGVVYLSEEFETQTEAQTVGSLNFKFHF
jgi:hypothetical protein